MSKEKLTFNEISKKDEAFFRGKIFNVDVFSFQASPRLINQADQLLAQIKMTEFNEQGGKTQVMLQIIDVSARILYDKQKEENKLVSLINASLSHEVRNPLNSIIAQNIEKKRLYEDLKKTVDFHPSVRDKTSDIMHQLN